VLSESTWWSQADPESKMYDDVKMCEQIRFLISSGKQSIRGLARDRGISRNTVRRILNDERPNSYVRATSPKPKFDRVSSYLLQMSGVSTGGVRVRATDMHRKVQAEQGDGCSYSTVNRAVRAMQSNKTIWDRALDHVSSLGRKEAVDFLREISSVKKLASWRAMSVNVEAPMIRRQYGDEVSREAVEWIRAIQNDNLASEDVGVELACPADAKHILNRIRSGGRRNRNKGVSVLCKAHGIAASLVCQYLGISRNTYQSYNQRYQDAGVDGLFLTQRPRSRKSDNEQLKTAVFRLLHQPPSEQGFNRASWKMDDLTVALKDGGNAACPAVVREITKAAGYKWRKAKTVLTSHDPEFAAKLSKVQQTLHCLRPDEAFFSIDEFGPFSIKSKPGRVLVPPGEVPFVDQWQKSRGWLILTAALELSGNQVTHFYSSKKNTDEMVKMMELLIKEYRDRSRIFLSWDAASWHVSKKLGETIDLHNRDARQRGYPTVELVPLPASAQFLNVIESVFSGMARAIIHNSDYRSTAAATQAIDRYFLDRNTHFRANPKKAGRKIWGMERVPSAFSPAHNCKDPAYR
jgi:transposase